MMLTQKQEEFAKCIVEGMTNADAYRKCYKTENMTNDAIYVNASKLLQNTKVALRIKELREQLSKPSILTAQERLEYLTRIIKGEEKELILTVLDGEEKEIGKPIDINTRLKAMDIMNKMQGEYVQKIDANVNADVNISIELTDE